MTLDVKFEEQDQTFNTDFGEVQTVGGGENGATFIPNVSQSGVISWTNDKGLENPTPVNIKGAKGDKGDRGEQGIQGIQGAKGTDGVNGKDGANGQDGFSPIVAVADIEGGHKVTITDKNGAKTFEVMDGKDGQGGSGGSVQADWSQSDSTAQDYIKNRPFYVDYAYEPIVVNYLVQNNDFIDLQDYGFPKLYKVSDLLSYNDLIGSTISIENEDFVSQGSVTNENILVKDDNSALWNIYTSSIYNDDDIADMYVLYTQIEGDGFVNVPDVGMLPFHSPSKGVYVFSSQITDGITNDTATIYKINNSKRIDTMYIDNRITGLGLPITVTIDAEEEVFQYGSSVFSSLSTLQSFWEENERVEATVYLRRDSGGVDVVRILPKLSYVGKEFFYFNEWIVLEGKPILISCKVDIAASPPYCRSKATSLSKLMTENLPIYNGEVEEV